MSAAKLLAERKAWAQLVKATIDNRDAMFACEDEQPGAEEWHERTSKAEQVVRAALRGLGVNVDALLEAT